MSKQRLMPPNHWDWSAPPTLSQGWKTDGLIFVGGQLSVDARGRVIGRDVKTQTRNIMESMRRVLNEGGADIGAAGDDDRFVDRETGSEWSLTGEAVSGPLAGQRLEPLPVRTTFWFAYVAAFPEADIYSP